MQDQQKEEEEDEDEKIFDRDNVCLSIQIMQQINNNICTKFQQIITSQSLEICSIVLGFLCYGGALREDK